MYTFIHCLQHKIRTVQPFIHSFWCSTVPSRRSRQSNIVRYWRQR